MTEAIIRVTSQEYDIPYGTELRVTIDESGDAGLNETDSEYYGTRWVFNGDYKVVGEAAEPKGTGGQYTLGIPVSDLIQLHDILDALPEKFLVSATLYKNRETGE